MQTPYLIGERIYLRPLELTDAALCQGWINDPEVRHTLLDRGPINRLAEEDFLRKANQNDTDLVLGIAVKEADRLIGAVGLHQIEWKNRQAMFGLLIGAKAEWGKGYGREATRLIVDHAFQAMNLNRVWLHVYNFNTRAIPLYEKLGFRKEGVLRQAVFRDGRYHDTITMAVLREEWKWEDPSGESAGRILMIDGIAVVITGS